MHELKNFNDQLFKNVISNPTEQELRNLAKPMEKQLNLTVQVM